RPMHVTSISLSSRAARLCDDNPIGIRRHCPDHKYEDNLSFCTADIASHKATKLANCLLVQSQSTARVTSVSLSVYLSICQFVMMLKLELKCHRFTFSFIGSMSCNPLYTIYRN